MSQNILHEKGEIIPQRINVTLTSKILHIGGLFSFGDELKDTSLVKGIHRFEAFRCGIERIQRDNNDFRIFFSAYDAASESPLMASLSLIQSSSTVFAVVGPSTSTEVSAVSDVFLASQIPVFAFAATATFHQGSNNGSSTVFRMVPKDTVQIGAIIDFMAKQSNLISAIFSIDLYGTSGRRAFVEAIKRHKDLKIDCLISLEPGFSLDCLKKSRSNFILIYTLVNENEADVLFKEYGDLLSLFNIIASDGWAKSSFTTKPGSERLWNNVNVVGFVPHIGNTEFFEDCYYKRSPLNTSNYGSFKRMWEKHFNCLFGTLNSSQTKCTGNEILTVEQQPADAKVAYIYDSLLSIWKVFEQLQNNQTFDLVNRVNVTRRDILERVKRLEIRQGATTGPISFDPSKNQHHHLERIDSKLDVLQFVRGKWINVGTWKSDSINVDLVVAWKSKPLTEISFVTIGLAALGIIISIISVVIKYRKSENGKFHHYYFIPFIASNVIFCTAIISTSNATIISINNTLMTIMLVCFDMIACHLLARSLVIWKGTKSKFYWIIWGFLLMIILPIHVAISIFYFTTSFPSEKLFRGSILWIGWLVSTLLFRNIDTIGNETLCLRLIFGSLTTIYFTIFIFGSFFNLSNYVNHYYFYHYEENEQVIISLILWYFLSTLPVS